MRRKYKIVSIVHSGSRGERGTPVTEDKYDGVIGCEVRFDPDDIHIDYGLKMDFVPWAHRLYDWWTISNVQSVDYDDEDNILVIETCNSIYYLADLGGEDKS